jgi:hypothetical protein
MLYQTAGVTEFEMGMDESGNFLGYDDINSVNWLQNVQAEIQPPVSQTRK